MNIRSVKDTSSEYITGCWLFYGLTGCGKTFASLSAPQPIALINNESKDPLVSFGESAKGIDIDIIEPNGFYEEMQWLHEQNKQAEEGNCRYKTIYKDGLTYTMSAYRSELANDRSEINLSKMTDKEKAIREQYASKQWIRDKYSVEQADWGFMSEMMLREVKLLNALSKKGIVVVATAISAESPKWAYNLRFAPSLLGKDFPSQIHGLFDFIGFIVQGWQILEDGSIAPPLVAFHSPEGDFLCRGSGRLATTTKAGPLHISKLLSYLNGGSNESQTVQDM